MKEDFNRFIVVAMLFIVEGTGCGVVARYELGYEPGLNSSVLGISIGVLLGVVLAWIIWDYSDYDDVSIRNGLAAGAVLAVIVAVVSRAFNGQNPDLVIATTAFALMAGPFIGINPHSAALGAVFGLISGTCLVLVALFSGALTTFREGFSILVWSILVLIMITPMIWTKHSRKRF